MPKKGWRKKLLQQAAQGQAGASGSGQTSTRSEHENSSGGFGTESSGVKDGRGDEKNSTPLHQSEVTESSELAEKRISFSVVAGKSATASSGNEAFPELPKPEKSESEPRTVDPRGGPVFIVDGEQYGVKENVGSEKLMVLDTVIDDINAQRPLRSRIEPKSGCREIQVLTNYFRVGIDTAKFPKIVYHYDVVINLKKSNELEGPSNELQGSTVPDRHLPLIWREFEKKFHKVLGARLPFDGKKNCYSAKKLNFKEGAAWVGEIEMTDPDDDDKRRVYRIQLKEAGDGGIRTSLMWEYLKTCETFKRVDFPQEVIQALDVVLRYSAEINFTMFNRRFYSGSNPHWISELLELWFGHIQSLTLGRDQKVYLNVDMANKAFTKRMKVADILRSIQKERNKNLFSSDRDIAVGNEYLKGKLVQYTTTELENGQKVKKHHRFICQGIKANSSAATFKFTVKKTQKETTIAKYFQEDKEIWLEHPDWPVVHLGNAQMNNCVPVELLEIVPQAYKGTLSAQHTSAMIRGAAKPPQERFERIQKSRNDCGFEKCPILEEFGMSVGDEKVKVNDAKRLLPPDIVCGNPKPVSRQELLKADGKFKLSKSLTPAKVPAMAVMNVSGIRDSEAIKHFLSELGKKATGLGLSGGKLFSDAKIFDIKVSSQSEVHNCLKTLKDNRVEFVIVIIGRDGNEYSLVKRVAEREDGVGILTQCVKWGTMKNAKQDVLGKILDKINLKLNGQNFKLGKEVLDELKFLQEPIMFLGADVTHPDANSKSPSVAAITASYDISGMCYQMHIHPQPKKDGAQEVIAINQFAEIIRKMIETYHMRTRRLPKRIIMFRDGVSEGQFKEIKKKEYENGIKLACKTLADRFTLPFDPKITFIVVKKRHHTRFRAVDSRDAVKPQGNIPPGTVVDTVITHPTEKEWFLNSHVGIQGTSKPSRYHVIHDDSNLTMEQLEKLTYYLCYTYQRCTQPVSYPAPTYYAHLAAFRARALLENEGDNANIEALEKKMVIHSNLEKYPMFYI